MLAAYLPPRPVFVYLACPIIWVLLAFNVSAASNYSPYAQLSEAIEEGDELKAVRAIDRGGRVGSKELAFAVKAGWLMMVDAALDHGVDIDRTVSGGNNTLIMLAVKEDNPEMAWLLLERGADPDGKTRERSLNSPLEYAIFQNRVDIAIMLIDFGANIAFNKQRPIRWAAKYGQMAIARRLIQEGADVNTPPMGKHTPLMHAAYVGDAEMVRFLLEQGADPSVKLHSSTAFDYAKTNMRYHPEKEEGYKEVLRILKP